MNPWSSTQRLGFRFLFAYLMLYTTSLAGVSSWVVPWFSWFLWRRAVSFRVNGSGDTAYYWIQSLIGLIASLVATLIWSIADRARRDYRKLHAWLGPWLRYGLGGALAG